jgi:hypothetical protein
MSGRWKGLTLGAVVVALVALIVAVLAVPGEAPEARTYGTDVYMEQGGAKMVVADGGEIQIESGGELDIQSGATTSWDVALELDSTLDVSSTLQYGPDDLYPVGYASSGQQLVYGTESITGTAVVDHGLTTVTFCMATLGQDPDSDAGDAAHVSVAVAANDCTVKVWQDDFVTAATETEVDVHWLVIGAP